MAATSGIQEGGWAAKLFSSALFCLWLSLASVAVWFEGEPGQRQMTDSEAASGGTSRASIQPGEAPVKATPADAADPDAA